MHYEVLDREDTFIYLVLSSQFSVFSSQWSVISVQWSVNVGKIVIYRNSV